MLTHHGLARSTAAGCDIVRVAVPSQDDAAALPAVVAKSRIPVDAANRPLAARCDYPFRLGVTEAGPALQGLDQVGLPAPVARPVMGCVVNGPGESREADLGVSCGNGKGQIFVRGQVVRTIPESRIVDALLDEALRLTGTGLTEAKE